MTSINFWASDRKRGLRLGMGWVPQATMLCGNGRRLKLFGSNSMPDDDKSILTIDLTNLH